jgi:hypothetical protein
MINERKKMKFHQEEDVEYDAEEMKCEALDNEAEANRVNEKQQYVVKNKLLNKKWFDRQLFSDVKGDLEKGNLSFKNPINNNRENNFERPQNAISKETQFNEEYDENDDSTD